MLAFHGIRKPITRLTTVCRRQMHLVRNLIIRLTFYLILVLSTYLRLSTKWLSLHVLGLEFHMHFLPHPYVLHYPPTSTSFMRSGSKNMAAQWPHGVYTDP